MMQHFLEVKQEYPDTILFYRCGDFYETFYEDAKTASKALDITLTSRDKNSPQPVPMAGVPHHAANQYISRLIDQGYKVAVCEQMEDPKTTKGMVKREVVRIVTPGLVVDTDNLKADENNYIVSICTGSENHGIAVLDISTGEFRCTEIDRETDLLNELFKLAPRELLLADNMQKSEFVSQLNKTSTPPLINYRLDIDYEYKRSVELLTTQFNTDSLKGFGVVEMKLSIRAAGALLSYVKETQKQQVDHLQYLRPYYIHEFMVLDESTRINLELERNLLEGKKHGSLLGVLDKCKTPSGSRTLKQWLNYPLLKADKIRQRLNIVEDQFLNSFTRETLRDFLSQIGDISRLCSRICMNRTNARDLATLGEALNVTYQLKDFLLNLREDLYLPYHTNIDPLPELVDELKRAISEDAPLTIKDGRMFNKGYNEELDELIDLAENGKDQILKIEAKEREALGIPTLKVRYNKVFGYYIELSKLNAEKAPAHYIRKQTLTNAERYITDELKKFEDKVLNAEDRRNNLEFELFEKLRQKIKGHTSSLMKTAETIGKLDALSTFAEIAAKNDYVRPQITEDSELVVKDGRHPVVEAIQKDEPFIPNDTILDTDSSQLLIVTGPNMAGKSTVMRQVALIVLMAQIGSFVPAKSATVGIVDRIFTRVGAADNLVRGLSTFMVEMTETANILHNATKNSLIILDEIGRGTSTFDGLSIAWAVAEHLHDQIGARTMFATHYHELTELAETRKGVVNMNIAVKEYNDRIIFLRKLVKGATNRSYGIQVGRLAGIPSPVIERSKEILKSLESGDLSATGVPNLSKRNKKMKDNNQLSLFNMVTPSTSAPQNHPILDEIDKLIPDSLSPIEALNILFELKKKREQEKD